MKTDVRMADDVINEIAGNLIVNIKETRIAVSKEMAQKIMV